MTVYADILMLVNFIVDYFLISLTGKFLHTKIKLARLISAAAFGAVFSLYILVPQTSFVLQVIVQIFMCAVLCLVAFGFKGIKQFIRCIAVLFCVNFAYSGAMIAVWIIFKPRGMVINNSVVYFDISQLFLIVFSVVGYFVAVFARKVLKRPFLQNTYCEATLLCGDKKITLSGIADTGNSLKDVFGISQILITDNDTVDMLLGEQNQDLTRFRKIPCGTITGESLLDGYRIDRAMITFNNKKYDFVNPILAVSKTPLTDAKIIVNPENLH